MELKVWVEGIQRIVCGVTDLTTCHDVVFALAHATGKSGRFTLIERWRNNERQLAPEENPLKILTKWGEYSNDVQFILQWNESNKNQTPVKNRLLPNASYSSASITVNSPQKHAEVHNVGVVKGVPHIKSLQVKESHSPKNNFDKAESPSQRIVPLAPPPYRDPPPPVNHDKYKRNILQDSNKPEHRSKQQESVLYNSQYRELVALINYQREKLSNQHADLTKFDAEIVFWESKEREKHMQLEYIGQELVGLTNATKLNQEQIHALNYVEEECEIVRQQEKTLKSEVTLLRSKLANCETELLQCKNKIRLVMDELQIEQRALSRRSESKQRKHIIEKGLLAEMERLQRDIESTKRSAELHHSTAETLKKEVAALETAIIEKKKQVELLVAEMKEANLQSLTVAPPEDLRAILEGPTKAGGSTRKMIGSPRQLENAVPTNKNPHGVWV